MTKAVGDTVSFRPTNINPPVTSIIWKHRNISGTVFKAIEWDDDGFNIPNQRFKGITTLDEKTGQITITKLTVEHSGVYTIDINSKEQEQRFKLEVLVPVPKPEIQIDSSDTNPDVVYLRCGYSETIIWKNSAGETLKGLKDHLPGEFIKVENKRNPDNYYTCTLKNTVSEKTSDPVYERDLFKGETAIYFNIIY
ncbi:CD48 antigen [Labeo rohita]|uniref:CD48 antigen n=1 Tax=Labeo rohita TaxID=84645 RepID=A0ABQ8L4Y6_LABRO|nr:CD48 antigen [Labeo rohita]